MPRMRILREMVTANGHVRPGDVREVPDAVARRWMARGMAEPATGSAPPVTATTERHEEIATTQAALETTSDDARRRSRRPAAEDEA